MAVSCLPVLISTALSKPRDTGQNSHQKKGKMWLNMAFCAGQIHAEKFSIEPN
jgi:hypothetical protein